MKKSLCLLVNVVMLFGIIGVSNASTTYNATFDFDISKGNPNGVWTYGWMDKDLNKFKAYTNVVGGDWAYWGGDYTSDHSSVQKNYTGGTICNVMPGQISLHPGPEGEAAVVRFTAPADGLYDITSLFFSGDDGFMEVGVRQGNNWLWQATDFGTFLKNNYALFSGDSIDFVVYGGYTCGNTPLELIITQKANPVPIPAAIWIFASGIAGIEWLRRKKHNFINTRI